jgi:AcrR family transcriptional regulator
MTRAAFLSCLAVLALLAVPALAGAAEAPRSLPFNKQNVYNYFRKVEEEKRDLPEKISLQELQERQAHAYAKALKESGYDFEATVQNALQFGEKGMNKLDDPRFLFLAGVFRFHPDVYLRLKLISKPTYDAVLKYFGN